METQSYTPEEIVKAYEKLGRVHTTQKYNDSSEKNKIGIIPVFIYNACSNF